MEVEGRMWRVREEVEGEVEEGGRGEGRKKSQKAGGVIIPSCNNSPTDCILTGRETEREGDRKGGRQRGQERGKMKGGLIPLELTHN